MGRMGLPLRGHRNDGKFLVPLSIDEIMTNKGKFRALLQLQGLGDE